MSKLKREECRSISIFKLKEWGYLSGYRVGGVEWTNDWSEQKNSINFRLDLSDPYDMYIRLIYTTTDPWTEKKTDIDHKYPILTTPCNYGGVRYWFRCSVYRNGVYCGRRVSKLYKGGGSHYFACRHCFDLTYSSRIDGYSYCFPDIEKQKERIKRYYYNGKPTRKYRSLMRMERSIYVDMVGKLGRIGKL